MNYDDRRDPEIQFPKLIQWRPLRPRSSYVPSEAAANLLAATAICVLVIVLAVLLIVAVEGLLHPAAAPAQLEKIPYPVVSQFFVHPANLPSPVQIGATK